MRNLNIMLFIVLAILLNSCSGKKDERRHSDSHLEAMLQGIWINADDETVALKVKNDTLYYTDAGIEPVHYRIYGDTIYIDGVTPTKYFVEKLTANIFRFRNRSGELVKLMKSDDSSLEMDFVEKQEPIVAVNQQLLKRDTIVNADNMRYHCYMQVNPTSFKVIKGGLNNEGIGVDKVYYDNIVNIAVYTGKTRLFSRDFKKHDFQNFVPREILPQCILSDILYDCCDASGVTFQAQLRIPESASSYVTYIVISPKGEMKMLQP